ncbi:MAG: ion transporter [FCB group bacterium]|jgi:voltage-gated sodium channel|nr:ion transporter [FCB group bacterium]
MPLFRRIAENPVFQNVILGIIVANAILIGIETDPELMARHHTLFSALNLAVQIVFVIEIAIRMLAFAPRMWRFFLDGWNVFDFAIVALSLLPMAGPLANVGRLARLLRALRVVSAIPELRLMVVTLLRSIPSLANVLVLLGLTVYVYAVVGVHLFGTIDPAHWQNLGRAALTLFQMLTLEGWVELQATAMEASPWAWIYFVSYVVVAVFVVVNLFIAIVINNLESAKNEVREEIQSDTGTVIASLAEIRTKLAEIESKLRR